MNKQTTLILMCLTTLAACGGKTETAESPHQHAEQPKDGTVIQRSHAPSTARVFFITPANGDTVSSPVSIEFGVEGMTIVKAGDDTPESGHHHLIVDAGLPPLGGPIPADEHYIHFGDGSTSTTIELEPGEHTLQLLLGDYRHIPHDPPVTSDLIVINVE